MLKIFLLWSRNKLKISNANIGLNNVKIYNKQIINKFQWINANDIPHYHMELKYTEVVLNKLNIYLAWRITYQKK